jgi:hypothetical protein
MEPGAASGGIASRMPGATPPAAWSRWRLIAVVLLAVVTTGGCVSAASTTLPTNPSTIRTSPPPDQSFSAPTDSDCRPPSPQTRPSPAQPEVKGTRLWALVFAALPITAAKDTKIAWRMGGHGAFHVAAKTADGSGASLFFGPELHGASSWSVPNTDEWGTGFVFPTAGCWRVHASRDDVAGDVYFLVVQP